MNFFKENRQVTHNSIFADFALPHFESARRIHHALAEWRGRTSVSCRELKTKLSKITVRSGTRQSPTFVINLTKVGSTLSLEERQRIECI
jgi:hypothetical protein